MLVTTNYAEKNIMLAQSIKATQFFGPCRCDSAMGFPAFWASPFPKP